MNTAQASDDRLMVVGAQYNLTCGAVEILPEEPVVSHHAANDG